MKKILFLLCLALVSAVHAQWPMGGSMGGGNAQRMNMGRFYGKVVDSLSGKPVEFAVVKIMGNKWDTVSKSLKYTVLGGMMSEPNGDFSIDHLPVMGKMKLIITSLGYLNYEKEVSFNLDMEKIMKAGKDGNWAAALNNVDRDLGNIRLKLDDKLLKEVVIDGSDPDVVVKLDRKIYNVEKNITATGGTAEDVMKQVPSVNVDIDGNVTLRNSSPQILIDGKPTTLTLDQIPADAIQSVEVITNPSAKYDASGGGGGILNIILKKNRKPGYNGSVRAGVDSRLAWNGGADINAREGKVNLFLSAMFNGRNSHTTGKTERYNLLGSPLTNMFQDEVTDQGGYFGMGRLGLDWFMNNRNTLTLSANLVTGAFKPENDLHSRTDTLLSTGTVSSFYDRFSSTARGFFNLGGALQFKHLFTKAGKELTADINYNASTSFSEGDFDTYYYDQYMNNIAYLLQQQEGGGENAFYSAQADFVNPVNDKTKLEMGLKGSYRTMITKTMNYDVDPTTGETFLVKSQSTHYGFVDQIYAGYLTLGKQYKKVSFQLGLRGESSIYEGELIDSNKTFSTLYPVELFPSLFFTWQVNNKSDLQFSYSRRINRPGFLQLIPFTDYSDSLNLRRGNPELRPEFTHSLEVSYLYSFSRGNSLLGSTYFKNTNDLMTSYQVAEFDTVLDRMAVISTYKNANASYVYGGEITLKHSPKSWMEYSINLNGYSSFIDAGNIDSALQNNMFSWFAKLNTTWKLPKSFTLQVSGTYRSRSAIAGGGGGRSDRGFSWGGGMGSGAWMGGNTANVQGYVKERWEVEASVRWEFLKEKKAALTVSIRDIFGTDNNVTYTASDFFTQTTARLRDARLVRINFSYRFGKFDASLFKRKNMKVNTDGMDMGM